MKPITEIEKAELQEVVSRTGQSQRDMMRKLLLRYDLLESIANRAHDAMLFHTSRCPMNILQNFSGQEEHLAEYRAVIKELERLL